MITITPTRPVIAPVIASLVEGRPRAAASKTTKTGAVEFRTPANPVSTYCCPQASNVQAP